VPEHVVFQCTNGVVLGLFSETFLEERFGRVRDGFRGVSVTIACENAEAVHQAHRWVHEFDDVADLDERPDESGWGAVSASAIPRATSGTSPSNMAPSSTTAADSSIREGPSTSELHPRWPMQSVGLAQWLREGGRSWIRTRDLRLIRAAL